ncbi:MAG: restriction endonuclease, partial [Gemmatales bacterium]|nr:restriction endonuclease [Gemmatales bacterium]
GHLVEFVGDRINKSPRSKVGDIIIQLNNDSAAAGARIVIEAKAQQSYTERQALEELAQARQNREAQMGIFVFSRKTAPKDMLPLFRQENDILTLWDPEDPSTDIYLQGAVLVALALCVRAAKQSTLASADIEVLENALRQLEKSLTGLEKIEKCATTIRNQADEVHKEATKCRKELENQLDALRHSLESLRHLFQRGN